jgi:integrase
VSKKSSKRAGRVVRYTKADGTTVTKHYPPYKPKAKSQSQGRTIGDLLVAWEGSPEWAKLAPNTKSQYTTYSRYLSGLEKFSIKKIEREKLLDIRDAVIKARGNGAGIAFARTTSAAFGWAIQRGWLPHSPATKLQKNIEHGTLPAWTEEDAQMALTALPEHLRRAVVLALCTGQRRGDLIAMQWGAYDGTKIRVTQEKTKRHQKSLTLVIPAPDELRAELDLWKQSKTSNTILTTKFGRSWNLGSNLSKQLQDALSKIEGFPTHRNIHGLRKLAATRLAQAGCTIHEIAAVTGHQSLGMIQLYTRSVDQEMAAESAAKKLQQRRTFVETDNNLQEP